MTAYTLTFAAGFIIGIVAHKPVVRGLVGIAHLYIVHAETGI